MIADKHYNFFGSRCVKDLKLARISLTDESDRLSLELRFAPSEFKHDSWLIIGYVDVVEVSINVAAKRRRGDVWPESRRLGDLQLDEILPDEEGCSHEIQMTEPTKLWRQICMQNGETKLVRTNTSQTGSRSAAYINVQFIGCGADK